MDSIDNYRGKIAHIYIPLMVAPRLLAKMGLAALLTVCKYILHSILYHIEILSSIRSKYLATPCLRHVYDSKIESAIHYPQRTPSSH